MALRSESLFLYGIEVNAGNEWIDFVRVLAGPEISAQLNRGYYSLSGYLTEIKRALEVVDTTNTYTVTADRTINGGLENRITIATSGAFLEILFGTGTHATASIAPTAGFALTDLTGATSYTGTSTCGTAFLSTMTGYNYLPSSMNQKVFGAVNVSAAGIKDALVFAIQQFIEATFMYEPAEKVEDDWVPFFEWAIQQRPFDFTPEITFPNTFFDVTMETTQVDGKALAFRMTEMLSQNFPNIYSTGPLKMRIRS